jgi:hypothetical protein
MSPGPSRLMRPAQLHAVPVQTLCEILHKTVPLNTPDVTANAMTVPYAHALTCIRLTICGDCPIRSC